MKIVVHTLTTNSDSGTETTVHATVHDALENLRGCFKDMPATIPDSEVIDWVEANGEMWVQLTQHELEIEVACLCDANLPCPLHDKAA